MATHPDDAFVRADGMRDLTMEAYTRREGDEIRIADPFASGPRIAVLDLSPEALDFLIDQLPDRDGMTEQLRYARKLAMKALWERSR
jgi:hypothetical protein